MSRAEPRGDNLLRAGRQRRLCGERLGLHGQLAKVVRAFVKQLRAKLGDDAADPSWIFNVRCIGYRMPRPGEPPRS